MTVFDDFYCGAVAGSDGAACQSWLQAGRDHRWAPPAPPGAAWQAWVPAAAALVVVVTLLLAARALRATRKPAETTGPSLPRAVPTARQVTVAGTRGHERTRAGQDTRTEARSAVSPGW